MVKATLEQLRAALRLTRYGLAGVIDCTERDIREAENGDPEAEAAVRPVLEALKSTADATAPVASAALKVRRGEITRRKAEYAQSAAAGQGAPTPAQPWKGRD